MPELKYQDLEAILDAGRLPVVINLHNETVFWASYNVQHWAPALTGDEDERTMEIVSAILATEALRRNGDI